MEGEAMNWAQMTWASAFTIIGGLITVLGFFATLLKLYLDHRKPGKQKSAATSNGQSTGEQQKDALREGESNAELAQKLADLNAKVERLDLKLQHLESNADLDGENTKRQIEEVRNNLAKLTDTLINVIQQ